jgi:hypothetical protein
MMNHLGLCPCGGEIAASTDPPCVAHKAPTCKAFDDLDPDEFLTYVRIAREKNEPSTSQ